MIVYHEASPDSYDTLVSEGLKCTSRGEKTAGDPMIQQTDQLLDSRLPATLKNAGVSRDNNLYAYIADGEVVQDITDGSFIPVASFVQKSKQLVLAIDVDPKRCYVSDLDRYDALKVAIEQRQPQLQGLADAYWQSLLPLDAYDLAQNRRVEIMITYDVAPAHITAVWNKP